MDDQLQVMRTISEMSRDQLNDVINAVKARQRTLGRENSTKFKVGDTVKFGRSTGRLYSGTVYKLNRTKAVVDTGDSGKYSVPYSMLQV